MKKSMKRIVSFALILCLTLSLIPATLATNYSFDAGTYASGDSVNYEGIIQRVSGYKDLEIPNWTVTKSGSGLSVVKKSVSSGGKNYYYPALTGTAGNPGTYTFTVYAEGDSGTRQDTHTITVTIAAKPTVTLSASAQDYVGNFTLTGSVSNVSGSYSYAYYRNTVNSTSGGVQFTPGSTSGSSFSIATGFKGLTEQKYYYYATITYNGKTYTSNVVSMNNPKYVPATNYKTLTATATVGVPFEQSFNYGLPAGSYSVEGDLTNASHPYTLGDYGFGGGVGSSSMSVKGTPTKAGMATYTVKATNAATGDITYIYIEINVKAPAPTTYDYGTYTFTSGDPVQIVLNNQIYTEGYYTTGTVTGLTNSGLAIGVTGGSGGEKLLLSGTAGKAGTYNISVPVTEAGKTDIHKVTVIIKAGTADITDVTVNDIALPAAGNLPDTTASVPYGANYSVTSVQWYVDVPGTGFAAMPASEKFAEDKTYYCAVTLAPKTGYAFRHGAADSYGKAYFAGSATILAAAPKDTPVVDTTKGTMVVKSGETALQKKPDDFVNPFVDVVKGLHWFYDDVMSAVKMGLVNGMDATHYKPDDNLTIAQAIKLAACMNQYYTDKKVTLANAGPGEGAWYNTYVNYAITKGIITFDQFEGKYNNTATRADYVTIFAKALPETEFKAINSIADNKVPDVKSDAVYAPAVYKLYRAGILTGSGSAATYGYFLPNDPIRRSEVAAILTRMMDSNARKTVVLP